MYSAIPYGNPPAIVCDTLEVYPSEMMFYLYLPVKFTSAEVGYHDSWRLYIPERLQFLTSFLNTVRVDALRQLADFEDHYIYLTAKTLWVEPGSPGNRPGWHADGYGSNGDLNYIWYDMNPTEFAVQSFLDIPDDDILSMRELSRQIKEFRPRNGSIVTYPCTSVLRLDESVVHRVGVDINPGVRTFLKASVSKHRYNLKGNSHNYLVDYEWPMFDRTEIRNMDNKDFVKSHETV